MVWGLNAGTIPYYLFTDALEYFVWMAGLKRKDA